MQPFDQDPACLTLLQSCHSSLPPPCYEPEAFSPANAVPPSDAQEFTFPDYSDSELHAIFKGIMAKDPRFKLQDEKYGRIAAARLGRQVRQGVQALGGARGC